MNLFGRSVAVAKRGLILVPTFALRDGRCLFSWLWESSRNPTLYASREFVASATREGEKGAKVGDKR